MIKREGTRSPWERACAIAFRARGKSSCARTSTLETVGQTTSFR